jgi:hypothetical protein
MKTFQDYLQIPDREQDRAAFVYSVINDHKGSDVYQTAMVGRDYDEHRNTTITHYRKVLYDMAGRPYNDVYSANYKIPSNFFHRFTTQEVQTLLGNGVTWAGDGEKTFGEDFDENLVFAAQTALVEGCAFGFFNLDHVEIFRLTEFAPLYDEETGALKAGVRFWQIDQTRPIRATFYTIDGYTEYLWDKKNIPDEPWQKIEDGVYTKTPTAYRVVVAESEADGTEILNYENYPTFPIVPLWGNRARQSEIIGIRSGIDAYDLIKSGFANELDNAQMYWILHNAGGMDDVDLAQFLDRLKTVHAAVVDDTAGTGVDAHTVEIPTQAREALLDRVRKDLYEDYMALDTQSIASGAVTATQIKAAYEAFESKMTELEYCVIAFIQGLCKVAGVEEDPTFTRSRLVNEQEMVQTVVQAAPYLSEEYVTKKILTILGDGDQAEEILRKIDADEFDRFPQQEDETGAE